MTGYVIARLLLGIVSVSSLNDPIDDLDRFLTEYRKALQVIRDADNTVRAEGTLVRDITRPPGAGGGQSRTFELKYYKSQKILKFVRITRAGEFNPGWPFEEAVYVTRPGRQFVVARDSIDGPYSLKHLGNVEQEIQQNIDSLSVYFNPALELQPGVYVLDLIGGTRFSLLKLRRIDGGLVRLDYAYKPSSPGDPNDQPYSVWFTVSPREGWVIREYEMTGGDPVFAGTAEYRTLPGQPPVPLKVMKTLRAMNGAIFSYKFVCHSYVRQPTPAAEFGLAYYGLGDAEPPPGPPPSRAPFWFLGLAALALLVAIAFRILAYLHERRHRAGLPNSEA